MNIAKFVKVGGIMNDKNKALGYLCYNIVHCVAKEGITMVKSASMNIII